MRGLKIVFQGKVQGVGFRWTVVERAEIYHILGSVTNLPDGTVEVEAVGEESNLEKFLSSIQKDPGFAHIESIKVIPYNFIKKYSKFIII